MTFGSYAVKFVYGY